MLFKLSGLTCPACKKIAEKRIAAIPGVKQVKVSVDSGEAVVDSDWDIRIQEIKDALKDTHYQVVE